MFLFALTVSLSAFLLFLVEPLIARIILPWFGGTAALWTTCLMFFQITLLLGYVYAHWIARLRMKTQVLLHIALLALSLLALPILPGPGWRPSANGIPALQVLALLAVCAGAPFLLLSATGPLLQTWCAASGRGKLPYRLYALSNGASLVALLSYPFIVEPLLGSRAQAYLWSALYGCFAVLCAAVAWRTVSEYAAIAPRDFAEAPRPPRVLLWIALAFCPSALLLAITNHLSQNIAPIPLLWVVPLAAYLLSLVLCFDRDRWYQRALWLPASLVFGGGAAYSLMTESANTDVRALIPLFVLALFCCSMTCHGELARSRPAESSLTRFYLAIASGGALGGLFVGLIAPLLFRSFLELQIGFIATFALLAAVLFSDPVARKQRWFPSVQFGCACLLVMLGYQLTAGHAAWRRTQRIVVRNFYGQLRVEDRTDSPLELAHRRLLHGTILHGAQYFDEEYRREPSTYYCETSGVGRAIQSRSQTGPVRLGLVGLGAGTLAAYGRLGDVYRFYEINPLVERLAQSEFTYLRDSAASFEVVRGDARRSLELERPQAYDVLAVDAFSGDAIPVHLLTVEALRQYFRHLKRAGLLAMHISNKYFDLAPVVLPAARALGKSSLLVIDDPVHDDICSKSDWVLLSSDPAAFAAPQWKGLGAVSQSRELRLWTDDYSNLLAALKRPGRP